METQKLDKNGIKRFAVLLLFFTFLQTIFLLVSGDFHWWNAWAFTGGYLVWILAFFLIMARVNPNLLNERGKKHENTKSFDKVLMLLYTGLFLIMPVAAGLDRRFLLSSIPAWISFTAIALTVPFFLLILWVFIVNNHFESMVRIQEDRDHQVCSDGPYQFIRHPTYLAAVIGFILIPFILGTYLALIPCSLMAVLFIIRTKMEDDTLRKELVGYEEYTRITRFRLFPGIW